MKKPAPPNPAPLTVDTYLAGLPDEVRDRVARIRAIILKSAPECSEDISYRMPAYKLAGRPLLYVAAFKSHIGLYPMIGGIKAVFAKEMAPYSQSKGTLRFSHVSPVPYGLIARITKFRAKEIKASAKVKPQKAKAAKTPRTTGQRK